uniref:C2 domain-containing protein n=1 Tax=Setaria digitata TaxID=48799 RepID=A0A915PMS6_9BILA
MSFIVDYLFERVQLMKIEIRNFSANGSVKTIGNVIGSSIFKLDELIGAFGAQLQLPLSTKTVVTTTSMGQIQAVSQGLYCGWILVSARLPEKAAPVILQFSGKNLEKKDKFFDETSVFFVINKVENDETKTELYRSETIREHSHPIWRPFNLHLRKIADNRNRLLEISVMYRDEMNKVGLIGSFLTTYAKMKYGPGQQNVYNLINPKKASKKGYLKSGEMELIKFSDVSFYSFLDYITSGTQLHLAIAVDFSSNSGINKVNDPHAFDQDFDCAINGIAGIVRDYTSSKMFPAFGLGAKIPPTFYDSQAFHLNFGSEPYCRGIDGVLEAFRKARRKVMSSDHAEYSPIVNAIARMVESEGKRGLHYFILIIFLSNGTITDSKELLKALTKVTKMPISIIFLGSRATEPSGFYHFSSSKKHLVINGESTNSDFVEFIDLNSVMNQEATFKQNARRIAERALRNVPWHLVAYMHKNNIAAKPPIQINRSSVFHSSYLIPHRPSQYDEKLVDKKEHIHIKSITPCAPRKHSENIVQRRLTLRENQTESIVHRSQSVAGRKEEKLDLPPDPILLKQRHPKRVLRRQQAVS